MFWLLCASIDIFAVGHSQRRSEHRNCATCSNIYLALYVYDWIHNLVVSATTDIFVFATIQIFQTKKKTKVKPIAPIKVKSNKINKYLSINTKVYRIKINDRVHVHVRYVLIVFGPKLWNFIGQMIANLLRSESQLNPHRAVCIPSDAQNYRIVLCIIEACLFYRLALKFSRKQTKKKHENDNVANDIKVVIVK